MHMNEVQLLHSVVPVIDVWDFKKKQLEITEKN